MALRLLVTMMILLICLPAHADRKEDAAAGHMEEARRFMAAGMIKRAEQECRMALKLDEDSGEARELLREIEETGRLGRAERLARQELAAAQEDYARSRLESCRRHLEKALIYDPGAGEALALSATLDEEEVEFDDERPFAESAEHYYLKGMKHYRRGRFEEALKLLERTREIYPGEAKLGRVVERCRENYEAVRRVARLEEAGSLIESLLEKGRTEEARKVFEPIRADYADEAKVKGWDKDIARAERRRHEERARGKLARAAALTAQGKCRQAAALMKEVEAVLGGEGDIGEQLKELRAACAEIEASQDLGRKEAKGRSLADRAESDLKGGDFDGAEESILALEKLGVLKKEASALRKRLESSRSERSEEEKLKADEHYRAGLMYYQLGKLDEARREWRRALELDPGNKKARKNLARLEKEK